MSHKMLRDSQEPHHYHRHIFLQQQLPAWTIFTAVARIQTSCCLRNLRNVRENTNLCFSFQSSRKLIITANYFQHNISLQKNITKPIHYASKCLRVLLLELSLSRYECRCFYYLDMRNKDSLVHTNAI